VSALAAFAFGFAPAASVYATPIDQAGTYEDFAKTTCAATGNFCTVSFSPIAPNKTFIMTTVSCKITLRPATFEIVDVRIVGTNRITHLAPEYLTTESNIKTYLVNGATRKVFVAGQTPGVTVSNPSTQANVVLECSIGGGACVNC
jgi:hypothetical protein